MATYAETVEISANPRNWTVSQTRAQLKNIDYKIGDDALMTLIEHQVDMLVLFNTTKEELMNINIKLGPATRIMEIAKKLRETEKEENVTKEEMVKN